MAGDASYFTPVDKKGNPCRPNSPKIVPNIVKKINPYNGKTESVQEGFKEHLEPNRYRKNYSGYWQLVHKNMAESNKHNLMVAAFECGNRLERRDENIKTAFTYGKRIKYEDLDDENYISSITHKGKCKHKSKNQTTTVSKPSLGQMGSSFKSSFKKSGTKNYNRYPTKSINIEIKKPLISLSKAIKKKSELEVIDETKMGDGSPDVIDDTDFTPGLNKRTDNTPLTRARLKNSLAL